jgi:hypothetical protein
MFLAGHPFQTPVSTLFHLSTPQPSKLQLTVTVDF